MHVAFVSTYPPQRCGIASYTRDVIAALSARDPSLVVGVCAEHGASSSDATPVWPCFDGDGDYVGPILDRLDELDATVVHVQHEYGIFGVDDRFHELLAGLRQRQRSIVVTMHTVHTALSFDLGCSWRQRRPPLDDLLIEQYQRRLGDGADAIIVHQERPIREVLLRQGVAPGHVRTIPHGTTIAPPAVRAAARVAPGTARVVAFGYFEPCKNHAVLIEALPLVRAVVPDVSLVLGAHVRHPLAATTEYRARCDRLVADLGLEAHVTFLDDPVPDEDVTTLLAGADVACFVYDEDTRSSSGALHRAVGCGVPVVASRIPKFDEVGEIADELLVNPRSPAEVARLLVRILSDGNFRAYARARSDRFAAATSWDRVARDHLSLYRELAVAPGSSSAAREAPPAARASPDAVNIFISYRHVEPDSRFLQRLVTHLASIADDVTVWTDKAIEPADEWRQEIEQAIERADVAIVLVSADSVASPFIRDVELPMLLEAHRQQRLRLVPLFVGPTGRLPPGIADVQGANSPTKPLVSMTRAKQEATFADLVTWLGANASAAGSGSSTARRRAGADGVALELVPAAGLLLDRAEIRKDIAAFLDSGHQRICVVHGFPGIGKTVLAADMVETHRSQFADVFWMTCRDNERSGRLIIARLDAFLRRNGDDSLRGLVENMADIDPEGVNAAVDIAVQALATARYLLVLDEFQAVLGTSNEVPDEITRRLVGALVRAAADTKLLVLSDRRPDLEPCADLFPTGAALEQEILGLPDDAVQELLRECGLDVPDAHVRRLISDHFAGNPTLLRVYCSFVTRHHRDPLDSLVGFASGASVAALIGDAVTSLGQRSRQTLERLAVLRAPLGWDRLGHFGLETDDVVTLLDSSLVSLDPTSHTIAMSPVVREFTLQATPPEDIRVAHRLAAAGYDQPGGSSPPRSYDDLRPLIESGNHRLAAGDVDAGASAILDAVELLVRWGYGDLADHEIGVAEAHSEDPAILARCSLQRGRIADQRGELDAADRSYRSAIEQAERVGADQTVADALFRIGRIHNARNDFAAAERELLRCVELCRTAGLERPEARARLALAWARKEQGAPVDDVVAAFDEALRLAEAHDDPATACDAHRQLGFFAWVRLRDRETCESHYGAAQQLATEHSLAKEIGAIHNELAYLNAEWGDLEAAEDHSRAAIDAAQALGDRYLLPGTYTNLAKVLVRRGDLDSAQEWLERSVREFSQFGNPGGEAYALHELAHLEGTRGQRPAALAHLERAHRLAVDRGLERQRLAIERTTREITGTDDG